MGIVKYNKDGFGKKFNIGQALKDGWGQDWEGEEAIIGLKLQDRKKSKHKVTVESVDWFMGIFRVHFKEGGWLCFDHAIEQFKCVGKN
jgi:hypothetical protein